jgi:hypothetical protein
MSDWTSPVELAMSQVNVAHTGINGWVHLDKKIVHFTPRCNHLEWLAKTRYVNGVGKAHLIGVEGSHRKPVEEGGARLPTGQLDLYDIYSWAADRFGWRQFIDLDEHKKSAKIPRIQIFGQDHPEGKHFARTIASPNFIFKDDYVWPRVSARLTDAEKDVITDFRAREAESERIARSAESDLDMSGPT